ncbi:hypothetical protein ACTHPH_19625 [Paenibacillus pasadenensis]
MAQGGKREGTAAGDRPEAACPQALRRRFRGADERTDASRPGHSEPKQPAERRDAAGGSRLT